MALEWFTRHQEADGRWSGRHFDDRCGDCAGPAQIDFDAATTGMTLLCFLSAGHTHKTQGPYRERVDKALNWLAGRVDGSGDLRGRETMYSQTIGAVALCEAYAMTRDPALEGPARRAVNFVVRGDGSRQNSRDTSVLGWQIMAVKSAERCGFNISRASFESAEKWLDRCAPRESPGRYGYSPGDRPGAAASAEAMFVRQLLGHSRDEPRMRESAAFILATPPQWRKGAPTYYWYYATLALFQQQGDEWKRWNEGVVRELLANQRREGAPAGSWDPTDEWSQLGGRIYQTAVCTLSLEVYYRYAPAR